MDSTILRIPVEWAFDTWSSPSNVAPHFREATAHGLIPWGPKRRHWKKTSGINGFENTLPPREGGCFHQACFPTLGPGMTAWRASAACMTST